MIQDQILKKELLIKPGVIAIYGCDLQKNHELVVELIDLLEKDIKNGFIFTDLHKQEYKHDYPSAMITDDIQDINDMIGDFLPQTTDEAKIRKFIVFDICIKTNVKTIIKNKLICGLLMNARHYNSTVIMSFSNVVPKLYPVLRANIDYVCLTSANNQMLKDFYEPYAGFFESLDLFKSHYNSITDNDHVYVVNNASLDTIPAKAMHIRWFS